MASIEQFAKPRGWIITGWHVDRPGSIPKHTFTVGGSLVIGIVQGATPACSLVWLDLSGQPCSARDLPFQEGMLYAPDFSVSIGGSSFQCDIKLTISADALEGTLTGTSVGGVEGNTGTFAADANPGG
jgi:hypothetical protein